MVIITDFTNECYPYKERATYQFSAHHQSNLATFLSCSEYASTVMKVLIWQLYYEQSACCLVTEYSFAQVEFTLLTHWQKLKKNLSNAIYCLDPHNNAVNSSDCVKSNHKLLMKN